LHAFAEFAVNVGVAAAFDDHFHGFGKLLFAGAEVALVLVDQQSALPSGNVYVGAQRTRCGVGHIIDTNA